MKCDPQCARTCHQAKDPKSCVDRCANVKHFYDNGSKHKFICLQECPKGYEAVTNKGQVTCEACKPGQHKPLPGMSDFTLLFKIS